MLKRNLFNWLHKIFTCPPLTRGKAADLIDRFATLNWYDSGDFDPYFNQAFDDQLLKEVAQEFLAIQHDYETNVRKNNGKISDQSLLRLKTLSAKLRSVTDSDSD